MKELTLFIITLMLVAPVYASELAPWVSDNVRLGDDPPLLPAGTGRNQAEPHAVRALMDPDLVLATFQEGRFSDGGARNNGYAVSEDGGFTWRRDLNPRLTRINGGTYYRATDPVGGIAHDGSLYLNSLVAIDEAFNLGRLVVQRSDDRGLTWTNPMTVYTGLNSSPNNRIFPDKNWMVVNDYPESPNSGRVIVTWTNFRTLNEGTNINDYLIMSAYSDDRGETWSQPAFITEPQSQTVSSFQYQGSQPVFLPGGGLAVVYHSFVPNRLEVAYSPDGGETFPYVAVPLHERYYLYDSPNMRDGSFLPSASVARETGDLFVAYTSKTSPLGTDAGIFFTRSERQDGGGSPSFQPDWNFSTPVRIDGTTPQRVIACPTIAVSPDGMIVTVYYYDNRNSPDGNNFGDFYAVQSIDGGETWTSPFRLTGTTFDLRLSTSTSRGYMIGDYFGFAAPLGPGQAGIAVWIDTREGTSDPWSARIGGLDGSVFDSWVQANLPYSIGRQGAAALRNQDPDRDGIPLVMEYVTGRSPYFPDEGLVIGDGLSFKALVPGTDPETVVTVEAGTGIWPDSRNSIAIVPQKTPFGEGYWETLDWATAGDADHIRFGLDNGEAWYLLGHEIPFRWVLEAPGSWVWSPWFGYLYTAEDPWLFHVSLGWIYRNGDAFYSPVAGGYLYPRMDAYPWVYRQDGSFLYILEGSPWVYDTGSGSWWQTY